MSKKSCLLLSVSTMTIYAICAVFLLHSSSTAVAQDEPDCSNPENQLISTKLYWSRGRSPGYIKRWDCPDSVPFITDLEFAPYHLEIDSIHNKMYMSGDGGLYRINLDTTDLENIVSPCSIGCCDTSCWMGKLKLDPIRGKMYWITSGQESHQRNIFCANLDGTAIETVVNVTNTLNSGSLSIDLIERKLYWAEDKNLKRSDIDGSNIETIFTDWTFITFTAVDWKRKKIYWIKRSNILRRADLDGSNIENVITSYIQHPSAFTIDVEAGKLYWNDRERQKTLRANLDGTNMEEIVNVSETYFEGLAINFEPMDCNENGYPDYEDVSSGLSGDCDSSGVPDECEFIEDCNDSGLFDACDILTGASNDCNNNFIPDECEPDCNLNEISDECDITDGFSEDCNSNLVPDECEPNEDCNNNGQRDICEISDGLAEDCNSNEIPDICESIQDCNLNGLSDYCDVSSLFSSDCNNNFIPDDCELTSGTGTDCNNNGTLDDCDQLPDCDFSNIPDLCEIQSGAVQDCNLNGIPDLCDITDGVNTDCNSNNIPDVCDIAAGTSLDCSGDGMPDECDLDCNDNTVPDSCDILYGTSIDCNMDGVPDECTPSLICDVSHPCMVSELTPTFYAQGYGSSVSMDGPWAIVTDHGSDFDSPDREGHIFIYKLQNNEWFQHQIITSNDSVSLFGYSSSIHNGRMVIGAPTGGISSKGEAYVYKLDDNNWNLEAVLTASSNVFQLRFGDTVAIHDDVIVVLNDSIPFVFRWDGSNWIEEQKLVISDPNATFYRSVSIQSDRIAVCSSIGVIIFHHNGSSWIEEAVFSGAIISNFSQNRIVIASGLSLYSLILNDNNTPDNTLDDLWLQESSLAIDNIVNQADGLGQSISLYDDYFAWGAYHTPTEDDWHDGLGVVFLFQTTPNGLFLKEKLVVPGAVGYGYATAMNEGMLLASAFGYQANIHAVGGDCNGNNIADLCDIILGTSNDDDNDGKIDDCVDCNDNGVDDVYDLASGNSTDCNENKIPDECDIEAGSKDFDLDALPDECKALNRYISVTPIEMMANAGLNVADGLFAIRVTLSELDGFEQFNGQVRWLGPSQTYSDNSNNTNTFQASQLQCEPHFSNWDGNETYAFGADVVPNSVYAIQVVDELCPDLNDPACYSAAQMISTARWGDVIAPFAATGLSQPDIGDVLSLVRRWLGSSTPSKTHAQLQNNITDPSQEISVDDVLVVVNAWLGAGYPFAGPTSCSP